jgi:hypothetical protein
VTREPSRSTDGTLLVLDCDEVDAVGGEGEASDDRPHKLALDALRLERGLGAGANQGALVLGGAIDDRAHEPVDRRFAEN